MELETDSDVGGLDQDKDNDDGWDSDNSAHATNLGSNDHSGNSSKEKDHSGNSGKEKDNKDEPEQCCCCKIKHAKLCQQLKEVLEVFWLEEHLRQCMHE